MHRLRPVSALLALLMLVVAGAAPALALGVGQVGGSLRGAAIDTPGVAASCADGSCAGGSCVGGSCAGGGLLAASGGVGGFLQGLVGFFKNLFSGIVNAIRGFFGNIFGGGSSGGGCNGGDCGGGCNGGDCGGGDRVITPPVGPPTDNGTAAPPRDGDAATTGGTSTTGTTGGTTTPTGGTTTTGDTPATGSAPPAVPADLAKAAGLIPYAATQNYNRSSSSMLNDVESHIALKHGGQYRDSDPATWTHETTHGINSDIRNGVAQQKFGSHKVNGFYLGGGQAFVMREFVNTRKRDAARYIPQNLRDSRFNMYITGQTAWDDTPSYIFDEWVAYTNGGMTSVELGKKGQLRQHSDAVKGALEFTIYSLGLAMAVERQSPAQLNAEMKAFLALQMRRAMTVFHEGQKIANLQGFGQKELLSRFLGSPDAEAMRAFVKRHWGEAFFNEVFQPR